MRRYANYSVRSIYVRNNRSLDTPKTTVFEKDAADDRLNLAKSMEAVVDRATSLEEAAGCEAALASFCFRFLPFHTFVCLRFDFLN